MRVVLNKTAVGGNDRRLNNPSKSHPESLSVNNIMAKLPDQFSQIIFITIDLQIAPPWKITIGIYHSGE